METVDFLRADWICPVKGASVRVDGGTLLFDNPTDVDALFRLRVSGGGGLNKTWAAVELSGEAVAGSAGVFYVVDECNRIHGEAVLESRAFFQMPASKERAVIVKVFPCSSLRISKLSVRFGVSEKHAMGCVKSVFKGDLGVVVPAYPSVGNMYPCAFVHSRVKAYLQEGLCCDVICAFDYQGYCIYEVEGVHVVRMPVDRLASLLVLRRYAAVFLHFLDLRYARVIESIDLNFSQIFLWSHGPETRYWDWPIFTTPYFSDQASLTDGQKAEFKERDEAIAKLNEMPNISWVFVSESLKNRSEELLGIVFKRAHVIPNVIDERRFAFHEKPAELRKKVFLVRKFENIAFYALDIDMAAIVELSHRPCFADMEFDIYGTGPMFDELVAPVRGFSNVHLHRRFLSHDEIAKVHASHGVALFATRYDSQGVSMGEAAMSGLAVVSSDIDTANYFLPNDKGLLCEVENPVAYADTIERLYNDPGYFDECSHACHEKMFDLCRRAVTVDREVSLVRDVMPKRHLARVRVAAERLLRSILD